MMIMLQSGVKKNQKQIIIQYLRLKHKNKKEIIRYHIELLGSIIYIEKLL